MNIRPLTAVGRAFRSLAWLLALAGIILLIVSGIVNSVEKSWSFHSQIGASLGAILLLTAVMARPDAVQAALTGQSDRYRHHAYITSVAFLAILALINFISARFDYEIDLTETGLFTLSPETIAVLEDIDEPVQVIGFFKPGDPRIQRIDQLLERYNHHTPYLSYEIHYPDANPTLARSYELQNYGVLFISGDHRYQADTATEQALTGGLMHVTNHMQYVVYFLSGHGEHQPSNTRPEGLSRLKHTLEQENYRVANLDTASNKIPNDASAVIIAGAQQSLSPAETDQLVNWMASGGRLMILVNPQEPVPAPQIIQAYGLSLPDYFVVEDMKHARITLGSEGFTPQLVTPMVARYAYHEITRDLNGLESYFPLARPIMMTPLANTSKSIMPLIATSSGSWAETDQPTAEPFFDTASDYPGPHHLAVAAEDSQTNSRLVLFGDTDFVTNQNLSPHTANGALFLNAVNWLAEDESLIAIRARHPQDRGLLLTAPQLNLIFVSTVIMLPLVVFSTGLVVWWKRR